MYMSMKRSRGGFTPTPPALITPSTKAFAFLHLPVAQSVLSGVVLQLDNLGRARIGFISA